MNKVNLIVILFLFFGCKENTQTYFLKKSINEFEHSLDTTVAIYDIKDLLYDSKNEIFILNGSENKIYLFDNNLKFVKNFGQSGKGPNEFNGRIIALDEYKDTLYILDDNGYLYKSSKYGEILSKRFLTNNLSSMEINSTTGEFLFGKIINIIGKYDSLIVGYKFNKNLIKVNEFIVNLERNKSILGLVISYLNYFNDRIIVSFDIHDEIFTFLGNGELSNSSKLKIFHKSGANRKYWKNQQGIVKLNNQYYIFFVKNFFDRRVDIQVFDEDLNFKNNYILYEYKDMFGKFLFGTKNNDDLLIIYELYSGGNIYLVPFEEIVNL